MDLKSFISNRDDSIILPQTKLIRSRKTFKEGLTTGSRFHESRKSIDYNKIRTSRTFTTTVGQRKLRTRTHRTSRTQYKREEVSSVHDL